MIKKLSDLPEWRKACKRYRKDITRFAVECLGMTKANNQAVTWQQEILFDSIAISGSRTTVASGHGCFGFNTQIKMANGAHEAVQNIQIGDRLMADDGVSSRLVLDVARGCENLYRFTYSDGTSYVFNESHLLCVRRFGIYTTITVREYVEDGGTVGLYCYRNINGFIVDMPIKRIDALGEGNYYGFALDGNGQFLGADDMVLHNTGKSRSAGIVALWHLLFFPESVMLFTAPQIGQLKTVVWKEINICLNMLRKNKVMGWLAEYVVNQTEKIYVKGFKDTWFVFAKTAPKNQATNIAGQHGDHYMLWVDEACGVSDDVMDVAINALTHEDNRAVLTSQPAASTGFFYKTHHELSHRNKGIWVALTFNSESSPLVSKRKLLEALHQYGSRAHAGYMIRIRGLFPELKGKFLLTRSEITAMLKSKTTIKNDDKYGYIISVDVGGGVGRDSSVITVAKVIDKRGMFGNQRHVHIIDVPLYSNTAGVNEIKAKISEALAYYPSATLIIDPIGSGTGLCQLLKDEGVYFEEVHWGVPCRQNRNKKNYFNKRSMAYVVLKHAIERGTFSISAKVRRKFALMSDFETQVARLPYTFDSKGRWQMYTKKEMQAMGISSPDIADTLAFLFREDTYYTPADSHIEFMDEEVSDGWDALDDALEDELSDLSNA